jgi:hypothetical protein
MSLSLQNSNEEVAVALLTLASCIVDLKVVEKKFDYFKEFLRVKTETLRKSKSDDQG